jgi:DNA-binding protein YbaB
MGMFDKMKEAKNMYSNIKKAQNEVNKIKVEGVAGAGCSQNYRKRQSSSS